MTETQDNALNLYPELTHNPVEKQKSEGSGFLLVIVSLFLIAANGIVWLLWFVNLTNINQSTSPVRGLETTVSFIGALIFSALSLVILYLDGIKRKLNAAS